MGVVAEHQIFEAAVTFSHINMLYFIWSAPLLFFIYLSGMRRRKRILSNFASGKGLSGLTSQVSKTRRKVKTAMILIAVLFVVSALTGPRYGYRWQEIERKGIDIITVLDCSKSMLAADIRPTRLDRAKHEVMDLINRLQGDRIGLAAFAGTAFLQCPLTLDYQAFYHFLNVLSPDFLPVGGTDIGGAIKTALSGFNEKDNSQKAVILITDGESTQGDPLPAAEEARKKGVKIFCIGIGKPNGAPVPETEGGFKKDDSGNIVMTKPDEKALSTIAAMTGGVYVRSVTGDMDLDMIYKNEIRKKMDSSTLTTDRKKVWEDRYQWFLLTAILFFAIDIFLPLKKKTVAALFLFCVLCFDGASVSAKSVYESVQKGISQYENKNYDQALKHFIDAQLEDPQNHDVLYNIGNTYYRLKDYESAVENYEAALDTDDEKLKQKLYYNQGNAYFRTGKLNEAVAAYKKALKLNKNDEKAVENLEFVQKRLNERQQQKTSRNQDNASKQPSADPKKSQNDPARTNAAGKDDDKPPPPPLSDRQPEKDLAGHEKDEKQAEEKGSMQPAGQAEKTGEAAKQAERMLNRLHDKPGRAMIPFYEKRKVTKDW